MRFYLLNYGYHSLLQVIELKMSISLISGSGWYSFKQQLHDDLIRAHTALNQATQTASNALAADKNTAAAAKAAAISDYCVVYYRNEAYLEIERKANAIKEADELKEREEEAAREER